MQKQKRRKKPPKRVLALPDLEQAKSAVLSTLTSKSGQRSYEHAIDEFVDWYSSEPRLALNRNRCASLQNLLGGASRSGHNQFAARRRQAGCVRSRRFRPTQPGISGWHPPCQKRSPHQRPCWQLAHGGSKQESVEQVERRGSAKHKELRHARISGRLWSPSGRTPPLKPKSPC
jgi:hypothetical protein